MEIILSPNCKSFTGTISRKHGYYIQQRNNRFFSKRKAKGFIPPDGHWRFILDCAELAQDGLIVADIKVDWLELQSALFEARLYATADAVFRYADRQVKSEYDANDILKLKTTFGL